MELFEAIIQANKGLQGRVQGIQYGIVSRTDDPLGMSRVQCLDAAKGGKSETDWLSRVLPFPGFSPPLPALGETVLIGYIDGDPHNGIYFGSLQNLRNPTLNTGLDLVIQVGDVSLKISPDGAVELSGVTGLTIGATTVAFQGVQSFTINNKEVTTLGAKDTDNETLITKGW